MEDELVAVVLVVVSSHGALQLEGNGVADVVVGRILPIGANQSGVVDVLDLLLGANAGGILGGNGDVALNEEDVVGVGVNGQLGAGVLDVVVAVADHVNDSGGLGVTGCGAGGGGNETVNYSGKGAERVAVVGVVSQNLDNLGGGVAVGKIGNLALQRFQQALAVYAVAPGNV